MVKMINFMLCVFYHNKIIVKKNCKVVERVVKKSKRGDFPGGPVVKTPRSQYRGPRFDPW